MQTQTGIIKLIALVLIAIIILSYLRFDIRGFFESDAWKNNFGYVWNTVVGVWDTYLAGPAKYLWNDIFLKLIWSTFVDNLEKMKAGKPNTIQESAPKTSPTQ